MKFTKIGSLQRVGVPSVDLYRIVDSDGLVALLTRDELVELYALLDKELTVVTNTVSPCITARAIALARIGDTLGAIKEVRTDNTCTLMEAKSLVESWCEQNGVFVYFRKLTNTPTMTPRAIALANQGTFDSKNSAINEVYAAGNCTLVQAKELVEQYMSDNNIPTP